MKNILSAEFALGFGTYGRRGAEGRAALMAAVEAGYRHFDTAQSYDTESEVGQVLAESGLARDALFVTTKIDMVNYAPGKLAPSLEASLGRLRLDRVDLTLLHWPSPNGDWPLATYLDQLVEAQEAGLTAQIGVSNFPVALLAEAIARVGEGRIAVNQFECNPVFRNRLLADFCQAQGVAVTCYLPIAKGRLAAVPEIAAIAARLGGTPEQVGLAWELAKGYAAIPTSGKPDRIRSNLVARDLRLDAEDMATIEAVAQLPRAIAPAWGPDWDPA